MLLHTVTQEEDGLVLLSFLKENLRLSRGEILRLKAREDGILLDGVRVTVRAVLHRGQTLRLSADDRAEDGGSPIAPVALPLSILYEDEDICLCNKSGNMPTHPSHGHHTDTLANALAYHYRGRPFVFRAVQRLDRETSGVVLTARSSFAAARLSRALVTGEMEKEYLAVVYGTPPERGEITLPIRRAPNSIMLREVCGEKDEGAQSAVTRFRRLATDGKYSLVWVSPITGRTHQIRVHMTAIGHRLCGDTLYGDNEDEFTRCALHACRLSFPHPRTGKRLSVTAPPPEDITLPLSDPLRAALTAFFASNKAAHDKA